MSAVILWCFLPLCCEPRELPRGFGTYFNPGYFEDHVVCEVWNVTEQRWLLVDPQFDETWKKALKKMHGAHTGRIRNPSGFPSFPLRASGRASSSIQNVNSTEAYQETWLVSLVFSIPRLT